MTPKEALLERLAVNGRTVSGLRITMREVAPLYQAQHDELCAKIARGERGPAAPGTPGSANYNPPEVSVKACLSEAFPSASRVGNVPLLVQSGEEVDLFCLLSGMGPDTTHEQTTQWLLENSKALCRGAGEIGSHSSRYAHTGTRLSVIDASAEIEQEEPYLSSRTVTTAVRLGYAGNSAIAPIMRPLFAGFSYQGRMTSLFLEVRRGNEAFLEAAGIPAELSVALGEVLCRPVQLTDRVAQVCWPLEDGSYHALTPLPAVAVLDELAQKHHSFTLHETYPGLYLPTASLQVGGANPQNAGAFNSATGGSYPLFLSRLFTRGQATDVIFERRMWANSWLNSVPKGVAERFKADLSNANAAALDKFVDQQVQSIAKLGMAYAMQVCFGLRDGLLVVSDELQARVVKNPAYRLLCLADQDAADELAGALVKSTIEAGASVLNANAALRERLFPALRTQLLQAAELFRAEALQ